MTNVTLNEFQSESSVMSAFLMDSFLLSSHFTFKGFTPHGKLNIFDAVASEGTSVFHFLIMLIEKLRRGLNSVRELCSLFISTL